MSTWSAVKLLRHQNRPTAACADEPRRRQHEHGDPNGPKREQSVVSRHGWLRRQAGPEDGRFVRRWRADVAAAAGIRLPCAALGEPALEEAFGPKADDATGRRARL